LSRAQRQWRILAALSVLTSLLFAIGFGWAVKEMLAPQSASEGRTGELDNETANEGSYFEQASEIRITAIGDSLTKGTGDATGKGYVKRVEEALRAKSGKPVRLINNLAINGMEAGELADKLVNDRGYAYALREANLILLTIGGNDLFQSALESNKKGEWTAFLAAELQLQLPEALNDFKKVIEQLHRINPNAKVIYTGLYNPFYDIAGLRGGSLIVQQWNTAAYAAVYSYIGMSMVPTFDLFEDNIGKHLSEDHFHPNEEGYKKIARRIVESVMP